MRIASINVSNPLKTWWKARKYFKFPKPRIKFFYRNWVINKILEVDIHDIYWKDKWNSPRHEVSPKIYFCLFNKIGFEITFPIEYINEFGEKENYDMEYWEYLLDYLYYSKSLKVQSWWTRDSEIYTITKHFGKSEDGSEDVRRPLKLAIMTHLFSLNKRGLKEFKKLYDKRRNN